MRELPPALRAVLMPPERGDAQPDPSDQPDVARTDSLLNDGFIGLSAPILNHLGEIVAAVTIIGPRDAAAAVTGDEQSKMLARTADEISLALGSTERSREPGVQHK
jgi:hypothetical protein